MVGPTGSAVTRVRRMLRKALKSSMKRKVFAVFLVTALVLIADTSMLIMEEESKPQKENG